MVYDNDGGSDDGDDDDDDGGGSNVRHQTIHIGRVQG